MLNDKEVEAVEEEVVEESTEETTEETTTEEGKEEGTEKKPAETLEARKARLERQLGQVNKKLGVEIEKPEKSEKTESKPSKKSNDLDYGEKAYLATQGIKGTKEHSFVKDEMKKSGQDMDTLLENPYFQSRLTEFREQNKTSDATPTGKRSGGPAVDTVEYWAAKPMEEVPKNMRLKVVNHKLEKDKKGGIFYNS